MRPYVNTYLEPGDGYEFEPIPFRNGKRDGYSDVTETGTVPGEAYNYTVELNERITPNGTLTVLCDESPLTVIPWGHNPGAGDVAVNYDLGLLQLHESCEGQTLSVLYTPGGSPVTAGKINEIQRALVKALEGGGGGALPVVHHDAPGETATLGALNLCDIGYALSISLPPATTVGSMTAVVCYDPAVVPEVVSVTPDGADIIINDSYGVVSGVSVSSNATVTFRCIAVGTWLAGA